MSNERQKRLMQEALDAALPEEFHQELRRHLDADAGDSVEYGRLSRVDRMLRSAPLERAPQHLALRIMARLAQTLEEQQKLSGISGLALALGLALVVLVALPILVAAVSLVLSAVSSSAALSAVIGQIAGVLAVVVMFLQTLVQGAQSVAAAYPQSTLLLAGAVPIVLYWLLRVFRGQRDRREQV